MTTSELPLAHQDRSRQTRRVLLDAGLRLLSDGGPEALTIAAVSAAADVAGATVYRRFRDKDGLLAALQAEFTADFRAEFADRLGPARVSGDLGAPRVVEIAVRGLADTFRTHATLLRVFAVLGLRNDDVLAEGGRASRAGGQHFRDLLLPFQGEFPGPSGEESIDVAYRIVYAACMHQVLHGPQFETERRIDWPELGDELVRITTGYLCGPTP